VPFSITKTVPVGQLVHVPFASLALPYEHSDAALDDAAAAAELDDDEGALDDE
jgi:hypothetical protein